MVGAFVWSLSYYVSPGAVVNNFSSTPSVSDVFSRAISAFWETEIMVKTMLPLLIIIALWLLIDSARRTFSTVKNRFTRLPLQPSL